MAKRKPNRQRETTDPPPPPQAAERCPRCGGLDRVPVVTPKFIMAAWFACPHCNYVWGVPRTD
jgi:transcription elongation factor Elf1